MTERLYYHDSYQVDFQAQVIERLSDNGRFGLVLDQTSFYPASGGQPADNGRIDELAVEEVLIRDRDGAIIHWLSAPVDSDKVTGHLDWSRRFDHMQQHTGQHILSQAFERTLDAATVGFHMSAESSTLDLDIEELSSEQIARAEQLANEIVWQNRAVTVRFVSPTDAQQLPLRKIPPARDGSLRLVDIDEFDLTACGGTHVRQTGEVGIIKVTGSGRQSGNCRLEFLCGRRALEDYAGKHGVLARLSSELTTGYWGIEDALARLRSELKQVNRSLKRTNAELIQIEAQKLASEAVQEAGSRLICRTFVDRDVAELRRLASTLTASAGTVVLFGLAGPKSHLLFARSEDLNLTIDDLLKATLPSLGDATGGGSAKFAQGGGPAASESEIQQALSEAKKRVLEALAPATT